MAQVGPENSLRNASTSDRISADGDMAVHSVAAMVWCDNPIVAWNHGRAFILIQGQETYNVELRPEARR